MARKQKTSNAATELLASLLSGLVDAADGGDDEALTLLETAGLSLSDGESDSDDDSDDDFDDKPSSWMANTAVD